MDRLALEFRSLLRSFDLVTSLVDFYGFRRKGTLPVDELAGRVRDRALRGARARSVHRVLPYIQLHEFEALLFSDVNAIVDLMGLSSSSAAALRQDVSAFETPEDINDGPDTAPSKRLLRLVPRYDKLDGPPNRP